MDIKSTYNKLAYDWYRDHQDDRWWVDSTNKFISYFKKGDIVLDAGCGSGVKAKVLSKSELKVVGIDISEKLLEIAKKEAPSATFYGMDMRDVGKLTEQFDGIFSQASLLHIPKAEVQDVIKKMYDKLKPKGYFYIAVKEKKDKDEEIVAEEDYGYRYERFFSYYTLDEIKKYLENLNMKMVYQTIAEHGKTNWIQVIGKK